MTLNDRISKILEYSQLTSSEFADEIEVQRSSISHITSGRNKPSLDFLIKVKERFPELNWDWLINGEGEMIFSPDEQKALQGQDNREPLPNLFSIIDKENFGKAENTQYEAPREFTIPIESKLNENLNDSQRLETQETPVPLQNTENQGSKLKRIILLYENGRFESFEP